MSSPQPSPPTPRAELVVPRGAAIFRQGDPGDSMFFIERGRVRIVLHCDGVEAAVAVLEAGDFFGELSLLSDAARSASAEALDETTLLVVRRDVFAMMMQDDLDVVFRMLHAMGERLARTDRQFRALLEGHSRIRLLAEALRRAAAPLAETPVVVEIDRLAAELGLNGGSVRAMVDEFVGRGAGVLAHGAWRLDGAEHVGAVLELLRTYAARASLTGSRAGPSDA